MNNSVLTKLKGLIDKIDRLSDSAGAAVLAPDQSSRKIPIFISRVACFPMVYGEKPSFSPQELYFTNGAEDAYITRMSAYTYIDTIDSGATFLDQYDCYSTCTVVVPTNGVTFFGASGFCGFDWTWNYRLGSTAVAYASSANNVPVPLMLSRTSLDWSERGYTLGFSEQRPQLIAAGDSLIVTVKPISFPYPQPLTLGQTARFNVNITLMGFRNGVMA